MSKTVKGWWHLTTSVYSKDESITEEDLEFIAEQIAQGEVSGEFLRVEEEDPNEQANWDEINAGEEKFERKFDK